MSMPTLVGLTWAIMIVLLMLSVQMAGWPRLLFGDDAMRMVGAIDLFHGQSWFDRTQHRDNTPFGADMHWWRVIDAGLALLITLFTPLLGEAAAIEAAAVVWPLLVLLGTLAVLFALSERLVGPSGRLPLLLLTVMALPIYSEFHPGRVDHHNVQIALTMALILATMRGRTSVRAALVAGLIAATSLAVGTETLPAMVTAMVLFPLFFVLDPKAGRPVALAFAGSLSAGTTLHLALVTDPALYLTPACDALSMTYVAATGLYAVAVFAAVFAAGRLPAGWARFIAMAVAGGAVIATLVALFPNCLRGPYGDLDPALSALLLSGLDEAEPLWAWLQPLSAGVAIVILPYVGLAAVVAAVLTTRGEARVNWLVLLGFVAALVAMMIFQVRGFRLATIAVLPAGAFVTSQAWAHLKTRQTLGAALRAGVTFVCFMGVIHWSFAQVLIPPPAVALESQPAANLDDCIAKQSYAKLAALPPGRLIGYMIIGPALLLHTSHQIVSAGYHRNQEGLRDMQRFFSGDEAVARAVARERNLDYLVYCRSVPLENGLWGLARFTARDADGNRWSWLTPLTDPAEAIQIYRIDLPGQP